MLYLQNSYIKQFESEILKISDNKIFLKESYFYARSGGQPGDKGIISKIDQDIHIVDTVKEEGLVAHIVQGDIKFQQGDRVIAKVDWQQRYRHMRMHTTMHLLCSVLPFYVTGGQIGFEKSRIDFDLGDSKYDIDELEGQVNSAINKNHTISYEWITKTELESKPELVRTLSVQPPNVSGKIRLVKIGNIDLQPCGGTHVNSTKEIGVFNFIKFESKGKKNKRIHFKVES